MSYPHPGDARYDRDGYEYDDAAATVTFPKVAAPVPKKRARKIALVGVVGAGLLTAGTIAAMRAGTHTAAPAAGTPVATHASPTPSGSVRAAVIRWRTGGGQARVDAMAHDLKGLGDAGTKHDFVAARRACTSFQTDVAAARAYGPIPDQIAQQHWSKALAHFASSASDCVAGARARSVNRVVKSIDELKAGTTELDAASARVMLLGA
jgi:hypothetical protein